MVSLDPEHRRLLSLGLVGAAGGWAIVAAVMILARTGLWAFWPVLLVIILSVAGLTLFPDASDATAPRQ